MSEKFPKDWKIKPLGSFIKNIGDGGTPSTSDQSNFGGGIPWIVISDIQREIWKTKTTLSEKGLKKSSSKLWKPQTVILSTGATIGQVGIAKTKLATKQGITGIECDDNLLPEYLYYFLKNNKHLLLSLSQGSTIEEIRAPTLVKLNVSIPPLPEQKKIASILTSVDDVIEKIQAQINKLQDLKKAIMNELLTRGIVHTEFKDSDLGRIPKNWIIKNFSEVTSLIKSGLSRKLSHQDIGLPIINSGNITKDGLDTTELKYWYLTDPQGENTENYFLDEGDILLNFINSISQIGKSCIFRDIGRSTIYTTNIFRIKSNKCFSSKFLFLLMNHDKFQKEIQLITKPAVNQASFTKDELLKIRVQVPPIEEQKKIENIIFSLDDEISTITKKFNKYFFLKKSLMQDLLTGKVRVSVN